MNYAVPEKSIIILVGVAGSGKSTLAKNLFGNNSLIVSSDQCREEICGNEADQSVTAQAFELFYKKICIGLKSRKRVIADATNLDRFSRAKIYAIARKYNAPVNAIMFDVPLDVIKKQNAQRARVVPEFAIDKMYSKFQKARYQLYEEISDADIIVIDDPISIKTMDDLIKLQKGSKNRINL